MKKQALSIEQMNHLRKLGLDTRDASLCWTQDPDGEIYTLGIHDEFCYESSCMEPVPAYTLKDVLDKLPSTLCVNRVLYWLCIDMADERISYHTYEWKIFGNAYSWKEKPLIVAAYELLVWCIEEGYVKTKGGGNV